MALTSGTRLGVYEVTAQIGAGGMGEVYRAIDTKLKRQVAIKILPSSFAADQDRLARFQREAEVLASLNHPNIAAIYGLEESSGRTAIVMELVEGDDLSQQIARRAIPLGEALPIAKQIAEALEAAHDQGIIHRDLKPANIKLRPDGTVKVLDFGLAKALDSVGASTANGTGAPTLTSPAMMTGLGVILGTAAYMSPEQARGRPVDKRTDVWAFGCVLYEMLTARRAFPGDTPSDALAAVLAREPSWTEIPDGVPAPLRRVIQRCLTKDPNQRMRDIGDVRIFLDESLAESASVSARPRPLLWMIPTAVLTLVLAAVAWSEWRPREPVAGAVTRLSVDLGPEAVHTLALEAAISPDGRRLAYVMQSPDKRRLLATRVLDQSQPALLAGTENAASPFFSPDGRSIGFFADGKLKKIGAAGGAVITIANANATMGASWGDDQNIYFTPGTISPLMRVSANGGTPQEVITRPGARLGERGDATHRWPQALPGSRAVLFTSHKIIAGFDDAVIEAVLTATGERRTLVKGGYFGRFVPTGVHDGYLLYVREGVLFAIPFDPDSLTVHGSAVPVLDDIAGDSDEGAGQFAFAGSTTLVYRSGNGPARRWPILWLDGTGKTKPLIAEPGAYYTFRLSPDGTRLALTVDHGDRGREIEVYDWQRGTLVPLTSTGEVNLFPVWSPDGKYILFESSSPHGYGLGVVRADGSGAMQRIGENDSLMIPYSFSPDGDLIYSMRGFWIARFDTTDPDHLKLGKPEPFAAGGSPAFSPDGRWIAYRSAESGRDEVYVRQFHGSGAKWQVSTGGEGYSGIVWGPHDHRLYYVSADRRIMAVDYVAQGNSFVAGRPRVWADVSVGASAFPRNFSISADGQRFAVMPPRSGANDEGSVHVTFVSNPLATLPRRDN